MARYGADATHRDVVSPKEMDWSSKAAVHALSEKMAAFASDPQQMRAAEREVNNLQPLIFCPSEQDDLNRLVAYVRQHNQDFSWEMTDEERKNSEDYFIAADPHLGNEALNLAVISRVQVDQGKLISVYKTEEKAGKKQTHFAFHHPDNVKLCLDGRNLGSIPRFVNSVSLPGDGDDFQGINYGVVGGCRTVQTDSGGGRIEYFVNSKEGLQPGMQLLVDYGDVDRDYFTKSSGSLTALCPYSPCCSAAAYLEAFSNTLYPNFVLAKNFKEKVLDKLGAGRKRYLDSFTQKVFDLLPAEIAKKSSSKRYVAYKVYIPGFLMPLLSRHDGELSQHLTPFLANAWVILEVKNLDTGTKDRIYWKTALGFTDLLKNCHQSAYDSLLRQGAQPNTHGRGGEVAGSATFVERYNCEKLAANVDGNLCAKSSAMRSLQLLQLTGGRKLTFLHHLIRVHNEETFKTDHIIYNIIRLLDRRGVQVILNQIDYHQNDIISSAIIFRNLAALTKIIDAILDFYQSLSQSAEQPFSTFLKTLFTLDEYPSLDPKFDIHASWLGFSVVLEKMFSSGVDQIKKDCILSRSEEGEDRVALSEGGEMLEAFKAKALNMLFQLRRLTTDDSKANNLWSEIEAKINDTVLSAELSAGDYEDQLSHTSAPIEGPVDFSQRATRLMLEKVFLLPGLVTALEDCQAALVFAHVGPNDVDRVVVGLTVLNEHGKSLMTRARYESLGLKMNGPVKSAIYFEQISQLSGFEGSELVPIGRDVYGVKKDDYNPAEILNFMDINGLNIATARPDFRLEAMLARLVVDGKMPQSMYRFLVQHLQASMLSSLNNEVDSLLRKKDVSVIFANPDSFNKQRFIDVLSQMLYRALEDSWVEVDAEFQKEQSEYRASLSEYVKPVWHTLCLVRAKSAAEKGARQMLNLLVKNTKLKYKKKKGADGLYLYSISFPNDLYADTGWKTFYSDVGQNQRPDLQSPFDDTVGARGKDLVETIGRSKPGQFITRRISDHDLHGAVCNLMSIFHGFHFAEKAPNKKKDPAPSWTPDTFKEHSTSKNNGMSGSKRQPKRRRLTPGKN